MHSLTASEARGNLYRLMDEVSSSHEPVMITGKRTNSILIDEADWRAITETLYLTSIPGTRESIKTGMQTPTDDCDKDLDW